MRWSHTADLRGVDRLMECVFCNLPRNRILGERPTAWLIRDAFPVNEGHSLAVTKRHVCSWFDTTSAEREDLLELIDQARADIGSSIVPDGFNIGINDGQAAGQTL